MSSGKKIKLEIPDSSNKIGSSPTSIMETSSPISPVQVKSPRPPMSMKLPHTLPKTAAQLDYEHEQLAKQHNEQQRIITDKETQKNIKEGRYKPPEILSLGKLREPQETFDEINKRYAKSDKEDFDKLDENKDWGLAFGGKKSKRKTKKSKRKIKKSKRKTKKSKRKSKKSKRKNRKTHKTRRK